MYLGLQVCRDVHAGATYVSGLMRIRVVMVLETLQR